MCYRFEKHQYPKGLLKNVDATYIIHLEDNGRLESIQQQLTKYQPTKTVYIVYNRGYKNCEKNLHQNLPAVDLVDAFWTCFKHAQEQDYDNILVLEDDFMFNEKIRHANVDVDTFLYDNKGKYMYMLGMIPWFQTPATKNFNHYTVYASSGTHACIYTRALREYILASDKTKIDDWDIHTNIIATKYAYHEPLCYQLFPETENSKTWINHFGGASFVKSLFKTAKLDTQAEPGYTIFYLFSKCIFWFMIIAFVTFLYFNGYQVWVNYICIFIFSLFFQQLFFV